jgi:hypothetical protein
MHPINPHIITCQLRRDEAMQAAGRFPQEKGIFVRIAWTWHRSLMRQVKAERDRRELESRQPQPKEYTA